eukprot:m.239416 g.239416  ORF g.239416 m.239416 type:complete len:201 (-) comp26257_c2_seq9:171-773(-)
MVLSSNAAWSASSATVPLISSCAMVSSSSSNRASTSDFGSTAAGFTLGSPSVGGPLSAYNPRAALSVMSFDMVSVLYGLLKVTSPVGSKHLTGPTDGVHGIANWTDVHCLMHALSGYGWHLDIVTARAAPSCPGADRGCVLLLRMHTPRNHVDNKLLSLQSDVCQLLDRHSLLLGGWCVQELLELGRCSIHPKSNRQVRR